MKTNQNAGGFTLIELLVVVLIIGILAAVALPQYNKAVMKSRMVEGLLWLDSLSKAEQVYYLENGKYTKDPNELVLDIDMNACGGDNTVFCNKTIVSGLMLELDLYNNTGTAYCLAQNTEALANAVCQSYQLPETSVIENDNGYNYYMIRKL